MPQRLTVTGNTILDAVIKKLVKAYPQIDVYQETINQGCKYPYFVVYCESFNEEKLMRGNYLQTFIISVLYQYKKLPETSYYNFNEVAYKLSDILDTVELTNGHLIRGYNKNWYPDNQKLEFYINYDIKVAREKEKVAKQMTNKVNVYKKQGGI